MKPGWLWRARSETDWVTTGLVSLAIHVLVIGIATHSWLLWVKRMAPAGTAHGTQRTLIYLSGHPSSSSEIAKSAPAKRMPTLARTHQTAYHPQPAAESTRASAGAAKDTMVGNDALGSGNVNIAWVRAFPAVKPDLSRLVTGSSVDVVVDVQIDDTGKVARARAKKGMGYEIDEIVVATVEQWVFYPAIRNGRPVASEQELHFHYERGRGAEPCGWDCFELAGR